MSQLQLHLGQTASGREVVWSDGNNGHLCITGQSGSEKSFLLRRLIEQTAAQDSLCVVLDYSGDFSDYMPPADLPFQRICVSDPSFSLNPLIGRPGQSPSLLAQQLLASLHAVFRMGPRATVALTQATTDYLGTAANPTISVLLESLPSGENAGRSLEAAREPLALLDTLLHCGSTPISVPLDAPGIFALDFTAIPDQDMCQLLVELVLQALWTAHATGDPPLILVLDECQDLNWGKSSMAARILREGRKLQISGWFSTQWISSPEAASALGQAALQIHFCPDPQHMAALSKKLASKPAELKPYQRLVQNLRRGQFLYQQPGGKVIHVYVRP